MTADNWDEIRTAYHVARLGTVSGAAEVLGVHHATVIRHIDALEARLGAKLFQRHARGYTATEAGVDLMQVAQATDDQLTQLAGRIKGRGSEVTGELVVTSLSGMAGQLTPVLAAFRDLHPDLTIRFLTGERLFRLEYGEAHVAIRAGSAPGQPDNVVQPLIKLPITLYASKGYIERFGKPETEGDLAGHRFIGHDEEASRAPFYRWMRATVPASCMVFRASEDHTLTEAVLAGVGIGFLSVFEARRHPDLVQIFPPRDEWTAPTWIVTHVDLHRTAKVQAFLAFLKDAAKSWDQL